MEFYENAHSLRNGAILLYTRPGRKKTTYQARLKIPGVVGYVIRSLKTADLNAAITEAEDLFYELRAEQKQGLDVKLAGNLRFKDLWKRFYDTHQAGLSIHRQRLHTSFAKNYFIPFLGEHRVADMPDAFVEKYWDWRINYYNPTRREAEGRTDPIPANAARTPSQKTLDMEAGMLRQIFRWGKRVGCVKREPWIKAAKVSHAMGVVRRPTFSETEWKRIYEYLRDWVKESMVSSPGKNGGRLNRGGPNALHRFQREMLRHYLLFLANSGLRPNEARQLLWRDIREEEDEDGKPALVVAQVPSERKADLIYLDAADNNQPYGYNPLRRVQKDKVPLAVSGLMEALKKLFDDAWGPRMEHVLRNALFALIECGDATLPDILRMLTDTAFQRSTVKQITNEQVREFWTHEFPKYNPRYRQEMIAPIQNKVGAFLADPRLYRIFTNPPVDLHFRHLMDTGKILIVNLAKGRLGEDSANLLGALLVTTLNLAAFSRSELPEQARRPFYLHIDEFQNFTTLSVANSVSELRKFKIGLVLANQHLHQLEPEVMHAVLGNAGTLITFRTGPEDARKLVREFEPVFNVEDMVNLPNHDIYLKLMIDGTPSRPFSATTLNQEYSIGEK